MATSIASSFGLSIGSSRKTATRKELDIQQRVIDSAEAAGGYGRKVTHPQLKGISDLLICMPGYAPVQLEVKDFSVVTEGFNRETGVTVHQEKHISAMNRACKGLVAAVLIRTVFKNADYISMIPGDKARFDWAARVVHPACVWDEKLRIYRNLEGMFREFGLARLK